MYKRQEMEMGDMQDDTALADGASPDLEQMMAEAVEHELLSLIHISEPTRPY